MTGIPASIAFSATGVRAAPSKGSSTIASTLSLMNVSTWAICALTSLVPSATFRSTSSYCSAAAFAPALIPDIQPWSAAGAEKPMVTFLPLSSFELAALLPPPLLLLLAVLSALLLVHPLTRTTAPIAQAAVDVRRRNRRCLVADMNSPRGSPPWRGRQVVWGVRQRTGGPPAVLIRCAARAAPGQVVGPAAAPGVGDPDGLPGMEVPAASVVPP